MMKAYHFSSFTFREESPLWHCKDGEKYSNFNPDSNKNWNELMLNVIDPDGTSSTHRDISDGFNIWWYDGKEPKLQTFRELSDAFEKVGLILESYDFSAYLVKEEGLVK